MCVCVCVRNIGQREREGLRVKEREGHRERYSERERGEERY